MNFRYKLMQFMRGRYGTDKLSNFLLISAVVLSIINIILRSAILQLIVYALIVFTFFRILSRNIEARRRENAKFSELLSAFESRRKIHEMRKADTMHIYKKCPKCRAVLRLPHRVGKHTTVCPKCETSFRVRVRK